jgi:hypothetical protein
MGVTVGGQHLKHTIVNGQDADIEGTTTKVKYKDVLLTTLLVQTIGNSSSSWLVDDPGNIEASNDTSILGGLPLRIIEVGWKYKQKQVSTGTDKIATRGKLQNGY